MKPPSRPHEENMSVLHFLINATGVSGKDIETIKSLNGTLIGVTKTNSYRDSQLNELLYVVIVIMFYAMALMILIATQVRKQRPNQDIEYYDEYFERNDRMKEKKKIIASITTVPEEGLLETTHLYNTHAEKAT